MSAIANRFSLGPRRRGGFTLVEVLIAATLTVILMGVVVQVFGLVGTASSNTRAVLETADQVRTAKLTLQTDLANLTAEMQPPLKPSRDRGYFEYVEGPVGPLVLASTVAFNINEANAPDTTVGDPDDKLMFTVRSQTLPYQGRIRYFVNASTGTAIVDGVATSETAEICYFVRGNVLYRRLLLVLPTVGVNGTIDPSVFLSSNYAPSGPTPPSLPSLSANAPNYDISFYDRFDVSVRQVGGTYDLTAGLGGTMPMLVANKLGDLTYRQNRYGHQPWFYPYDTRFWGALGLPTLRECTFYTNLVSAANAPVARWPFPLFDTNPSALPGVGAGTQNLWAVTSSNGGLPIIIPSPTNPNQAYQTNNNHTTTVPGAFSPSINLTINSAAATPGPPPFDAWANPYPWDQVDGLTRAATGVVTDLQDSGAIYAFSADNQPNAPTSFDGSTRVAEDVLLNNVLSFDVRAWDPTAPILSDTLVNAATPNSIVPVTANVYYPGDPGYKQLLDGWATSAAGNATTFLTSVVQHTVGIGAYVDLNYTAATATAFPALASTLAQLSTFSGPGATLATSGLGSIYDTGCFAYEDDGIDQNQDGIIDSFTNGFDDNGIGGVDDITEIEGPTPYPVPLKGIQVKIRVFEPDSRQIREVTITDDFLWE